MKALIVYTHPRMGSFTEAVKNTVVEKAQQAGAELQVIDLYAEGFDPVLSSDDLANYEDEASNKAHVLSYCAAIAWCDTLIFVYPTWWYGLPAILKGWLDRVLLPGVAFELPGPDGDGIQPALLHVKRLGVFTTCGASWWLTRMIGAPGRRTILRGVRLLCAKRCRTSFLAHYEMDSSTDASRSAHLKRVAKTCDKLFKA